MSSVSNEKVTNKLQRCNATFGLAELLIHAKEQAIEKSEEVAQEFSNILANEKCVEMTDAVCGEIARLIMNKSAVISVRQFLPKLVQKLEDDAIRDRLADVYKCFHELMTEDNAVLLTLLFFIVLKSFQLLSQNLSKANSEVIKEFLKDCRKKHDHIIERAVANDPTAAKINGDL